MSAAWAWYDSDDITPNATASYTPTNGTPSAVEERHLFNDYGNLLGATDSEDFLLTVISRPAGVGDYTMDDALAAGGYVEVRIIGSSGTGILNQTTGWVRLGRGRYLRVKGIPAGCCREFEMRVNVPLGAGILAKDYKLRLIEDGRAIALETGHTEGGAQGLRMGLGDTSFTELLSGFEMTEDGTPDNTVHLAMGKKVFAGAPQVVMDTLLTFDNLDSNGDALVATEEYINLVTIDDTGAVTHTKSVKGTAPLAASFIPDVPDGHREIGWIQVQFDAIINTADIHQENLVYGCAALVGTNLAPDLHPFEAIIGNAYIVSPNLIPLSLTDNDVNYVWSDPSGAVSSNVTGLQPESMSQLLYEVTTSAGAITVVVDCRQFIYPNPVEVTLTLQGTLAATNVFYGVLPTLAQAYLLPIGGIIAAVGDRGGTSGSTKFDIFATDRNDTYTTLFTSSGTQDERPDIAYNAAEPVDTDSVPEVLSFHGGARFKGYVVQVPGTASVGASITLRFAAVGAA